MGAALGSGRQGPLSTPHGSIELAEAGQGEAVGVGSQARKTKQGPLAQRVGVLQRGACGQPSSGWASPFTLRRWTPKAFPHPRSMKTGVAHGERPCLWTPIPGVHGGSREKGQV